MHSFSQDNQRLKSPAKRASSFEPETAAAFGAVVRAERLKQGIAQDQFALLANVDRSYFGKLERGERQPSLALIIRIAGGLGIAASDLIAKVERSISLGTSPQLSVGGADSQSECDLA